MTTDLNLQLKILASKDQAAAQNLERLLKLLEQIEKQGKDGNNALKSGSKEAAAAMRALRLEEQASKNATAAARIENEKLKKTHQLLRNELERERLEMQQLRREQEKTKKSTSELGSALKGLVSIAALYTVARGFGAISKAAMDAVESENLFTVSLGKNAQAAQRWSQDLSRALGLNSTELRKNLGVFTVMLKEMGLAEDQSYAFGRSLTKLAYDLSSFYNLNPDEAFQKLQSAIAGESEPLKRLGIIINETTSKQALLNHQVVTSTKNLTESQKVYGRYLAIMDSTTTAQGDLERTMDSTSNMSKRLNARTQELAETLGARTLPAVDQVISALLGMNDQAMGFAENQGPLLERTANLVAESFLSVVGALQSLSTTFNALTFDQGMKAFAGLLNMIDSAVWGLQLIAQGLELASVGAKTAIDVTSTPGIESPMQQQLTQLRQKMEAGRASRDEIEALRSLENLSLYELNKSTSPLAEFNAAVDRYEKSVQKRLKVKSALVYGDESGASQQQFLNQQLASQKKISQEQYKANTGGGLLMPVAGPVTSPFGPRKLSIDGASTYHKGVDIAAAAGTNVQAAGGGKVIEAANNHPKLGNYVKIDHGNGVVTLYAHLQKPMTALKGKDVFQGDVIGQVGSTGVSTGNHLHYGVYKDGVAQDPLKYFSRQSKAAPSTQTAKKKRDTELEKLREQKAYREELARIEKEYNEKGANTASDYVQKQIELHAELSVKKKEYLAQEEISQEEKAEKITLLEESIQHQLIELNEKYALEYAAIVQKSVEARRKIQEKQIEEEEKLVEASEKEKRELYLETQKIQRQDQTKAALAEAELSGDPVAIVRAKYSAERQEIEETIRAIQEKARIEIQEIQRILSETQVRGSTEAQLVEQINVLRLNALIQENSARQDLHYKELERIQEESQAWESVFQKRLGFIAKISGMIGNLFGGGAGNIFSKVSSFLGSNSSLIGGVFSSIQQSRSSGGGVAQGVGNFIKQALGMPVSSLSSGGIQTAGALAQAAPAFLGQSLGLSGITGAAGNFSSAPMLLGNMAITDMPASVVSSGQSRPGGFMSTLGGLFSASPLVTGSMGSVAGAVPAIFGAGGIELAGPSASLAGGGSMLGTLGSALLPAAIGGGLSYLTRNMSPAASIPLSTIGGAAGGALAGMALGGITGPVGALIGGVVGLGGSLLSAIFGGRKKREAKNLNIVNREESAKLNASASKIQTLAGKIELEKYNNLVDLNNQIDNIEKQYATAKGNLSSINERLSDKYYKKRTDEAQKLRGELSAEAQKQLSQLNDMKGVLQQKIKHRQKIINDAKKQMTSELESMKAMFEPFNVEAGYKGKQEELKQQLRDVEYQFWKDAPELVEAAKKLYQAQMRQLEAQQNYARLDTKQSMTDYYAQFASERLSAIEADPVASAMLEREKALKDLEIAIARMNQEFADDQGMLTKIEQYEADRRVNIERNSQEQIKAIHEETTQSIIDLIKQRRDAENMYDIERQKTRDQIKREALETIDEQIKALAGKTSMAGLAEYLDADDMALFERFRSSNPTLFSEMKSTSVDSIYQALLDAMTGINTGIDLVTGQRTFAEPKPPAKGISPSTQNIQPRNVMTGTSSIQSTLEQMMSYLSPASQQYAAYSSALSRLQAGNTQNITVSPTINVTGANLANPKQVGQQIGSGISQQLRLALQGQTRFA
jgi:murein DD-endopeptidase MepM/ murein hydrolase activator NlpD